MSVEHTYERHGLRYAVYDHLDQRHVIGPKEIASVNEPLHEDAPVDIMELNYEDRGPVEPRQMLCETLLDMDRRPGAIPAGERPPHVSNGPRHYTPLTEREKDFITEHCEHYPMAILALALDINPNSVKSHLEGNKGRLALKSRMFGEEDALLLRMKFIKSLDHFDDEE